MRATRGGLQRDIAIIGINFHGVPSTLLKYTGHAGGSAVKCAHQQLYEASQL